MNANIAALSIIVGASLLAGWVDVRFPQLTPTSFKWAGLHMVASIFVIQIGMRVLGSAPHDQSAAVLVRLFGIALPATIYLLLSAFWVLKLLHGLVDRRHGSPR
jgi:hypothetical protein